MKNTRHPIINSIKMNYKSFFFLSIFLTVNLSSFGQEIEIPRDFEEKVRKEYNLIPAKLSEGDSKIPFDKYYDKKKDEYVKSQLFYKNIAKQGSVSNICDNGTFESGDINVNDWNFFWSGGDPVIESGTNRVNTGLFNNANPNPPHSGQVHHQVQTAGPDPYFPTLNRVFNFPTGNSRSLRLGNAFTGCGLESVAKVVTINSSNSQLNFSYALVMDNPIGHGTAMPYFAVNLINASNTTQNFNNLINLGNNSNRISSDNPLLVPNNTTAPRRWKDWTCITADLSSLIGQTIIIEFVNRDCWACGHWSYTYIDNLCVECGNEKSNEGSAKINIEKTDKCGVPGKICIDYTLPNGNNPSLVLTLELIQNGSVIHTLNSPSITSGSTYCFQLNSTNTSSLNKSLQGFDFRIISNPKIGTFQLSPKIIGNGNSGIVDGQNNDYSIRCNCRNCSNLDISIERKWNNLYPGNENTAYQEDFNLIIKGAPIQEFRASVVDFKMRYTPEDCGKCSNKPQTWGAMYPYYNSQKLGYLSLEKQSYFLTGNGASLWSPGNLINELVYSGYPTDFSSGVPLSLGVILPALQNIDCCVGTASLCFKFTFKDINCNYCDTLICCDIVFNRSGKIKDCAACDEPLDIRIEEEWIGCCSKKLKVVGAEGANVQWSNGSTASEMVVNASGTYSVMARKECRDKIISDYESQNIFLFDQDFPILIAPNALKRNSNIPENRVLRIQHLYLATGAKPAYNATKYRLNIYYKWSSTPFRVIEGDISSDCRGFENGEILWDGRDANGTLVKQDVYNYNLELYNCNKGWDDTHFYQIRETICDKYKWIYNHDLTWSKVCVKWHEEINNVNIRTREVSVW